MTISVNREVIKNNEGRILFWKPYKNGKEQYNIKIWIDGENEELDNIEHVEYFLHPTFKKPIKESNIRDNNFSISIWTWGMFQIKVTIFFKDGTTKILKYFLSYDLPPDDGNNYFEVKS